MTMNKTKNRSVKQVFSTLSLPPPLPLLPLSFGMFPSPPGRQQPPALLRRRRRRRPRAPHVCPPRVELVVGHPALAREGGCCSLRRGRERRRTRGVRVAVLLLVAAGAVVVVGLRERASVREREREREREQRGRERQEAGRREGGSRGCEVGVFRFAEDGIVQSFEQKPALLFSSLR